MRNPISKWFSALHPGVCFFIQNCYVQKYVCVRLYVHLCVFLVFSAHVRWSDEREEKQCAFFTWVRAAWEFFLQVFQAIKEVWKPLLWNICHRRVWWRCRALTKTTAGGKCSHIKELNVESTLTSFHNTTWKVFFWSSLIFLSQRFFFNCSHTDDFLFLFF